MADGLAKSIRTRVVTVNWPIYLAGWCLIGISGIGNTAAVIMEIKAKEPKYLTLMKIFSFLTGLGGVLVGLGAKI